MLKVAGGGGQAQRAQLPVVSRPTGESVGIDVRKLVQSAGKFESFELTPQSFLIQSDALTFLAALPNNSIHAAVTDPPYGLLEYDDANQKKLRSGRGGVWRIPPALNGIPRRPLPRFTVLDSRAKQSLVSFLRDIGDSLFRVLVPGAHLFLASNPLLSSLAFQSLAESGFEKRGEVIRMVQTLRGGDRPKGAEAEFHDISVMPRSCWEPWGIFRKPIEGTVAENLRKWGTGGLRRVSATEPFKDVILCSPARGQEREIAPHPSLKPQRFVRKIVRASLPLGRGIVLDPFAGSGSTLAAAEALGVASIGIERDVDYARMARSSVTRLALLP